MGIRLISLIYLLLQDELGMQLNSWICWHYTQGMGRKIGFSSRHDDVLMLNKSTSYKFNLDDIRIPQKYYRARNNMRGANPGDVWEFSHVHYCNSNRQNHPTQKPEGLVERMVLASSDAGDVVIDPFSGSGTTARVCQQTNRSFLGFETEASYVAMSRARLEEPFLGFDSIDPRMERVPLDLRDPELRKTYLCNHERWFLARHGASVDRFRASVHKPNGNDRPVRKHHARSESVEQLL